MNKFAINPELVLKIGSVLIMLSGFVSLIISIPIGAAFNKIDPNGLFGHIGIINGIIAIIIGCLLLWFSIQKYLFPFRTILNGILTIVIGHIGAIYGALLIGTVGLILCYTSGVWFIVIGIKYIRNN